MASRTGLGIPAHEQAPSAWATEGLLQLGIFLRKLRYRQNTAVCRLMWLELQMQSFGDLKERDL